MKKTFRMMMAVAIAAFTFTACEDVPEPYNNPYDGRKPAEPEVVIEGTGSGTAADPYNVAAALQLIASLGADVNSDVIYVKGVINDLGPGVSEQYMNAQFYIADDMNGTNQLLVYRSNFLNNEKFTSTEQIKQGDEVVMCGMVVNFKGNTPEFTTGTYIYSLNGSTTGGDNTHTPSGDTVGTKDAPKTVTEALTAINAMSDGATSSEFWFVTGKVVKVTTTAANFEQYKNLNYLISADGTDKNTITVYAGNGLDNAQFSGVDALKTGDEVVVYGQLQKYVNKSGQMTPEIAKGNYLVKLTPSGGGGDTPTTDAKKVTIAEFNAAAESNDVWYELTGTVKNLKDGDQYGNFDLEDATGSVYVYGLLSEKGGEKKKFQDLVATKGIKNGSKLTIRGTRGSYNDKIEVMNAYFVNIEDGSSDTPTPTGEVKKVTVAEFNAAAESTDVWYQLTGTVKNLKDGDIYGNFDLEDATGSVYVYGLLSEKGGAKKLFQELVAAKGIKEGCTLTLIGNRGSYNDKIEVMNAYFVSIEGGDTPGGGGDEPGGSGGVLEGNTLTVVYGDLGISTVDSPIKLVDGTTLTFSQEDGRNKPVYHESTKIVRMYAHNSVTVNAGSKKIAKVVFNYDTYQGTPYPGNDELYGEAGGNKLTPAKDDNTVTFTGVNASSLKVVNDLSSGNSGGVQFRCTGLVITFAE